jgi:hypothetical protein
MARKSNEERLGFPRAGAKDSADVPPTIVGNPEGSTDILSYVNPTELVDLPSEGKFYPEEHPLHNQTTVEIREMTAKQEDILTSKSLIQKGVVLDRLIQSVLVDKTIKVEDLLTGDKNAILIALRISGYGAEYETQVTCPACDESNKYLFDLTNSNLTPPINLEECEDERVKGNVTASPGGHYFITVPRTGVSIEVRLLNGRDERRIVATQEMKRKKKLPENPLTEHFKTFVMSVSGVEDKVQISKFLDLMPAIDSRFLRKVYAQLTPNIDLTQEFVCENCNHEQEMEVPFTTDFFWPDA